MKSALCVLLLLSGALFAGTEKQCAVLVWEKNRSAAENILADLRKCGEKAIPVSVSDETKIFACDILILPDAEETPLSPWQGVIPRFLSKGGHLITDGHPERTFEEKNGRWTEAPAWIIPLAGTAHCVADFASFNYKGIFDNHGMLTLKQDDASGNAVKFGTVGLEGISRVSGRSLHKCQWRLTDGSSPGKVEFHDCTDVSPLVVTDSSGKVAAQHTAMVRHWCDFFPGSTIICADIAATLSHDKSLKLLYTSRGADYLKYLIELCRSRLPSDPSPEYYSGLKRLKKSITNMKDLYTEAIYLQRDLVFHSENNRLQKLPAGEAEIRKISEEFRTLEAEALTLSSAFAKFRFNRFPFAVKRKEKLISESEALSVRFNTFLKEGKKLVSTLSKASGSSFSMPEKYAEKGVVDVKYSCADYHPVSWFTAPPLFVEYENGRAIASTGVRGCCLTNYSTPATYNLPTPEHLRKDESAKEVYRSYVKETGLDKFTSHEINSTVLPETLCRKVLEKDTPYVADLRKGTLVPSKNPGDVRQHFSGYGIISSATDSPEFRGLIEFMAKRTAGLPGIHTRSITHEGMALGGYSEYGFAQYRKYLAKVHGNIAALNRKWGSDYTSFAQIRPPIAYPSSKTEQANMYDWISFRSEAFLNFMKMVSEIYRKADPGCRLTGCINQVSPLDGVEFYRYNQYLDFAASHNTPTYHAWYQIGLGRRGQLADNNEPKWISTPGPWRGGGTENEYQKSQRYAMYYYASQGMGQFAPYEWRVGGTPLRMGEYDGTLNLTGTEIKHFIQNKTRWERLLGAGIPRDNSKTGLYWSFVTKSQAKGGLVDTPLDQSLFCQYFRLFDRWNELLDSSLIQYEMITRDKLSEDISRLNTLIVPQAAYLEPETVKRLLNFARSGKTLVLEGLCGSYDPYKNDDGQLFDVCGMVPVGKKNGTLQDGTNAPALLTVEEFGPPYLSYEMMEAGKSRVLVRYRDGSPAAVAVPYGKGEIIYCGFSAGGFSEAKSPTVQAVLRKPLDDRFVFSADPAARLFTWEGENGIRFIFVLNFSDEWKSVPLKFAGRIIEACDIESGSKLNFRTDNGKSEAVVPVFPAGGRVIAVKCTK